MDVSGCPQSLELLDTSFYIRILASVSITNDLPDSFDARVAVIGSAKMPVERIPGRIRSSEASLKLGVAANAESRFYQIMRLPRNKSGEVIV
jgi:hypothetical protein